MLRGSTNYDGGKETSLQVLEEAIQMVAKKVLMSDGRRRPGWFMAAKANIGPIIEIRNKLTSTYFNHPTDEIKKALKASRKNVKRGVELTKKNWMGLDDGLS